MKTQRWEVGQKVILTKKKSNGYPHHKEIGDELLIIEVVNNPKYVRLGIKGNRRKSDRYWLHESFVDGLDFIRDMRIDELLSVEEESIQ